MAELQIDFSSLSPALQTAFSYLEEGNWRNANDCFDLELKQSPLDPYACLGKAMTACYLKTPEELRYCTGEILENPFFSAALKYAEGDLKDGLTQLVVRLNYDRQRAQSQRPAIDTPYSQTVVAAADAETETTADGGKANWSPADYAADGDREDNPLTPDGEANETQAPEEGEETVDIAKGKNKKKIKLIVALAAAAVVLLAGVGAAAYYYLIPLSKYNKAVDMINNKQFDEGMAILEELGEFSDAPEQYKTGLYVKALNYLANNDFENSKAILDELGEFKDAPELIDSIGARRVTLEIKNIAAASVGDVVTFGKFETDGNEGNGEEELRWLVLNNRDDLVTLITEQSIAAMRYHFNADDTNWADCSLRAWLNGTFYTSAFELSEADFICKNYITTPTNPDFPSPSGDATVDKVYLLSLNEALHYFSNLNDRKLTCTPASYPDTYTDYNDNCCWWLRTPGARLQSAVGVDANGQVMTVGYDCYRNEQIGVRPVIVVDISAVNGTSSASSREDALHTQTDADAADPYTAGLYDPNGAADLTAASEPETLFAAVPTTVPTTVPAP